MSCSTARTAISSIFSTSLLAATAVILVTPAMAVNWNPITPEELALTAPRIDPEASAEVIFTETRIYDIFTSGPFTEHHVLHYARVKIFNERGVEEQATVSIPYTSLADQSLIDISARTIQVDGSIQDMSGDAVFDKTDLEIKGKLWVKARSFTLPAVRAGSIIEYQWHEVWHEYVPRYVRIEVQQDIPVWEARLFVRPLDRTYISERMQAYPFNSEFAEPWTLTQTVDKYMATKILNLPGYTREPYTAGDDELMASVLIYYSDNQESNVEKFWKNLGKDWYGDLTKEVKESKEVKALAAEALADAGAEAGPEEKLRILADFVRANIQNVNHDVNGMTAEIRSAYTQDRSTNTTRYAKERIGYGVDMNSLFMAMALAEGFDARPVVAASDNSTWFRADLLDGYLLSGRLVAVKLGDEFRFYDPSNPHLESGMVDQDNEGQTAIIVDKKDPLIYQLPRSAPEQNLTRRVAQLKLGGDGSLEGDVEIELKGHLAAAQAHTWAGRSQANREEDLLNGLRSRLGEVEVTAVEFSDVEKPLNPVTIRYHIRVANYAQATGTRMFVQPNVFEMGRAARFVNNERQHPVIFPYAFQELDTVSVELPEGFQLESPDSPGTLSLSEIGHHNIKISAEGNTIRFERDFTWGHGGILRFQPENYPGLKSAFDAIASRDQHVLTVRAAQ